MKLRAAGYALCVSICHNGCTVLRGGGEHLASTEGSRTSCRTEACSQESCIAQPGTCAVCACPEWNLQFECRLSLQSAVDACFHAPSIALYACLHLTESCALQVRSLCRKQFFVRALGMKVAARQHKHASPRAQSTAHTTPHSPQSDRGVHMTQGDSWANTGILSNPLAAQRS